MFLNESLDAPAQQLLEIELLDYKVCACSAFWEQGQIVFKASLPVFILAAGRKSLHHSMSRSKLARLLHFRQK